ncbi:MAG: hypothetical protein RJA70_1626, partial [Pseudomonadota bacterium]
QFGRSESRSSFADAHASLGPGKIIAQPMRSIEPKAPNVVPPRSQPDAAATSQRAKGSTMMGLGLRNAELANLPPGFSATTPSAFRQDLAEPDGAYPEGVNTPRVADASAPRGVEIQDPRREVAPEAANNIFPFLPRPVDEQTIPGTGPIRVSERSSVQANSGADTALDVAALGPSALDPEGALSDGADPADGADPDRFFSEGEAGTYTGGPASPRAVPLAQEDDDLVAAGIPGLSRTRQKSRAENLKWLVRIFGAAISVAVIFWWWQWQRHASQGSEGPAANAASPAVAASAAPTAVVVPSAIPRAVAEPASPVETVPLPTGEPVAPATSASAGPRALAPEPGRASGWSPGVEAPPLRRPMPPVTPDRKPPTARFPSPRAE